MPKGRTGIIPGKKNFTAVGGVGAKRLPIRNLINAQALAPTSNIASIGIASILSPTAPLPPIIPPAVIAAIETAKNPPPTPTPPTPQAGPILFDLSTFDRNFDINGTGLATSTIPGGGIGPTRPGLSLIRNGVYYRALCRAAARWAYFLSFTPEMVAVIRQTKPNWNGIELNKFLIDKTFEDFSGTIAICDTEILTTNTSINTGCQVRINNKKTDNYNEYELFHVLTHEFGHALGMGCPIVTDGKKELLPKIYMDDQKYERYYTSKYFPRAYIAYSVKYNGILRRNTEKAVAGKVYDWIPLANSGHWSEDAYIYDFGLNAPDPTEVNPRYIIFRGIYNDIMCPNVKTAIDNYFISEITLGELCDIYTPINGVEVYNYQRNTTDSEVTSHDLKYVKDAIYFKGEFKDPLRKGIKTSNKEEKEEDKTCLTITRDCSGCKQIYLDACGECN
jgi:hypothetical protein